MGADYSKKSNNLRKVVKIFIFLTTILGTLVYLSENRENEIVIEVVNKHSKSGSYRGVGAILYYITTADGSLIAPRKIYDKLEVGSNYSVSVVGWETPISNRKIIEIR